MHDTDLVTGKTTINMMYGSICTMYEQLGKQQHQVLPAFG